MNVVATHRVGHRIPDTLLVITAIMTSVIAIIASALTVLLTVGTALKPRHVENTIEFTFKNKMNA